MKTKENKQSCLSKEELVNCYGGVKEGGCIINPITILIGSLDPQPKVNTI